MNPTEELRARKLTNSLRELERRIQQDKFISDIVTELESTAVTLWNQLFVRCLTSDLDGRTKLEVLKLRKLYANRAKEQARSTPSQNLKLAEIVHPEILPEIEEGLKKIASAMAGFSDEPHAEPPGDKSYIPPLQSTQIHDLSQVLMRKNKRSALERSSLRTDHEPDSSRVLSEDMSEVRHSHNGQSDANAQLHAPLSDLQNPDIETVTHSPASPQTPDVDVRLRCIGSGGAIPSIDPVDRTEPQTRDLRELGSSPEAQSSTVRTRSDGFDKVTDVSGTPEQVPGYDSTA